ncbi:MAG: hypothetical protein A4E65_00305 [Syntrophorhabdus sp. PtaU1.Bin153]|nr:MAG: hypothetical protein A4E65_00305 [Syntrophorhabdus sp. PtaU1.Bin153]
MDEYTPNTTGTVAVLDSSDEEMIASVATLLGPKFNLPKAGIIRPGIMRLKKGVSAGDEAVYKQMVADGATWDDIDKRLGKDGSNKSKLTPQNADYFSIRPRDCSDPRNVDLIHQLYADKSDGKLRSLPVWFPVNEWWNIIPHSLRCFGTNGIKYKSSFREHRNGKVDVVRVCEYPLELKVGQRVFGGRQWGERPCDPNTCPEYQKGDCKFGGTIQFYIPGVKGMGVWVLPTTSWYSLVRIKSALEAVSGMTGGRLARLFVGGKTPFILRKIYDEISTIDTKTGQPVRRSQWLIVLDIEIDMFELAQAYEERQVLSRGQRATGMLTGTPPNRSERAALSSGPLASGMVETSVEEVETQGAATTAQDGDFTPITEETEEEITRKTIIERITRAWADGSLKMPDKHDLKEKHPKKVEEMTLDELSAFETDIIGVIMDKRKNSEGARKTEDGKLV